MKLYIKLFIVIIGIIPNLKSQTDPFTMVERMGRGINLGNTFSAPVEGNWAPEVYEQYFIDVKAAGFNNVRIPMDFYGSRTSGSTSNYSSDAGTLSSYNGSTSDYVVDEEYLDRIEQVVDWSLNQDLITIIDFHGAQLKSEFLYTFSDENTEYTHPRSAKRAADKDKFKAIWLAISNRFKNHSENLLFEIVNEPYFEISASEMDELNLMIISAIRGTAHNNTNRNIVITGGGENSQNAPQQIGDDVIDSDQYLIASFHYYKPYSFTSSSEVDNNDFDWGTDTDKNTVSNHFDSVKTWSNSKNIPVTLGEFSADNENGLNYETGNYGAYGGPLNSARVEYHRYIAEQAINRGFSFSAWDAGNKSTKTIHLRTDNPSTDNEINGTWVTDVRDALLSSGVWSSQGPWTFTNSNGIWESTGTSANLTTSSSYSILDVNGAGNPQLRSYQASINSTTTNMAVIKLKNNTSNTIMRVFYNNGASSSDYTVVGSGWKYTNVTISANDTEMKTYYVRLDSNAAWTGTINNITIQFR